MIIVTETVHHHPYFWATKEYHMKFEKNLGTADRIVRMTFAAVVILLFLFHVISGPMAAALLALSVVLVITVLFSYCPIYRALGFNNSNESSP